MNEERSPALTAFNRRAMLAAAGTIAGVAACSPSAGSAPSPATPDLDLDLLSLVPAGEREAVRAAQSSWLGDDILDEAVDYLTRKRSFARLRFTGGRLCLARPHVVDAQHVELDLQGQLDFTRLKSGTALSVFRSGGGGDPFDRHPVLRGISLIGPGANTPTRGLMFESANSTSQNISVTGFVIRNFGLATGHGQNGFIIDWSRGHITLCDIGFEAPGGVPNGGERMAFSQVCFAANRVSLRSDNVNASIFAHQCSIDYPKGRNCRFVDANCGGITLTDCHIEGNSTTDPMAAVSAFRQGDSADAQLSLRGGRIVFADRFRNHVWENRNGSAPIVVDDVYMLRGAGRDGVLADGRIDARLKYLDGGGDHTNGHLLSLAENALVDGEFTGTTALLRPVGQAAGVMTASAVRGGGRPGQNALDLHWPVGPGGKAIFAIPAAPGEIAGVDTAYRLTGAPCSVRLVHAAARIGIDGTVAVLREAPPIMTAALAPQGQWTPLTGGTRNARAPAWVTHALLIVEAPAGSAATLRLDRITMTRIG